MFQIGANSLTDLSATTGRGVEVPRLPGAIHPKFCLISNESTTDNVVILPTSVGGFGSITTAIGALLPLGGLPLVVNTSGAHYIMHRSLSGTPTIHITPLSEGSPAPRPARAGPYAVQPTESFFFSTGAAAQWFETDDNFITLIPTANTAGFSVSFWAKCDVVNVFIGAVGNTTDALAGSDNWGFLMNHTPAPYYAHFFVDGYGVAGNDAETSADVSNAEWHHYVCVWDAGITTARMYMDGIRQANIGTRAALTEAMTLPMFVGKFASINTPAGQYWNGYVAEVSIWSGSLSDNEVFAIRNDGTPPDLTDLTGFTSTLVAWYNGVGYNDAAPGNPIVDKSGNGNDAVDAGTGGQVTLVADVP